MAKRLAKLGPVKFLTVHCAATPEGRDVGADEITRWDTDRFGQPSYHWVIHLDGTCVRTLPDSAKGAHVGGANTGNIGVCYVGGVDGKGVPKDTRTIRQRAALKKLVGEYCEKYPGLIVRGHRDWPGVKKACPSFDVRGWLREILSGDSGE